MHARRGDREHRHRRPGDAALGGEEPRACRRRGRSRGLRGAARSELHANGSDASSHDALRACAQGVLAYRRVRRRDQRLSRRRSRRGHAGAQSPAPISRRASNGRAPRSRTCATARTRTSRRRSTATLNPRAAGIATARQLQGKELSYNNVADADAAWECVRGFADAGVRHRQARQSVRCGHATYAARGVSQRVRDRSDVGLRRHHRLQPRGRRRDVSRRSARSSSRCSSRPHTRAMRSPRSRARSTCACSPSTRPASGNAWDFKRVGGGMLVQTADVDTVERRRR